MEKKVKIIRLKQWVKICRLMFALFTILSIYSLLPREEMTLIAAGGVFWISLAVTFGVQSVSLRLIRDALLENDS